MSPNDEYFYVGRILRPKGFKGEVKAILDVDNPKDYNGLEMVFLEKRHELIPMFIEDITIEENKVTLKFLDVDDADAADRIRGGKLFLPVSVLPQLKGDRFYYHEIIGFEIIDEEYGAIGKIRNVIDLQSNPLFEIDNKGKELLIPIHDDIIRKVDRKNRQITIKAPEGLIDIYM